MTIAEESTAWAGVSRPVYTGGLGFGQKWMMGWMHDTLDYFKHDPIHRQYHHNEITFSLVYAFTENFMLPLSHDEVVHGKGALMDRMPGDEWQRFANLRLLYGYMFTHPGTKLLFMGGEFGQTSEWSLEKGLAWDLLQYDFHKGVQAWLKDLNALYRDSTALYERQFEGSGFEWIDHGDYQKSVLMYARKGKHEKDLMVVALNFTPVPYEDFRLGVPAQGTYREVLNSDKKAYGGTDHHLNPKAVKAEKKEWNGRDYSISIKLPPLGIAILALQS
jgi:1,4-alpha-glucan branching enzyme